MTKQKIQIKKLISSNEGLIHYANQRPSIMDSILMICNEVAFTDNIQEPVDQDENNRAKKSHTMASSHRREDPCQKVTLAMHECMSTHGKFSDKCIREKLRQKRCFAEMLCRPEAKRFYFDRIRGTNASCSVMLESFAFPENEMMVPQGLSGRKDVKSECRAVVHELSKCMSKHRLGRQN